MPDDHALILHTLATSDEWYAGAILNMQVWTAHAPERWASRQQLHHTGQSRLRFLQQCAYNAQSSSYAGMCVIHAGIARAAVL